LLAGEHDLVWNAASFQEMPEKWIRYYKAQIERLSPKHIVLFGGPENMDGFNFWELFPEAITFRL